MLKFAPALVLALALTSTACEVSTAGEEEHAAFQFDATTNGIVVAFKTSIAVGMRVDVLTQTIASPHEPVRVSSAISQNPEVVTVVGTVDNRITLEAVSPGTARITVNTANGTDAFTVTTAALAKTVIDAPGYLVSDSPQSLGVQGGVARFFVKFYDANSRLLVGQEPITFTITPATAATALGTAGAGFLDLQLDEVGPVTLQPTGGEALVFEVIAPERVTQFFFRNLDSDAKVVVGASALVILRGETDEGQKVAGVAARTTFTSETPATCRVEPGPALGEGAFSIRGLTSGACQVKATFGTLSETRDIEVIDL